MCTNPFTQGHGSHAKRHDPARTGVDGGPGMGGGASRQQERGRLGAVVNCPANHVPDGGHVLPFVDEGGAWPGHSGGFGRDYCPLRFGVQGPGAAGAAGSGRSFADALWTIQGDCGKPGHQIVQDHIKDSRTVLHEVL